MSRLTEREPHWLGEEFWVSAQEPDEEELDEVYMKLKHYEDLEEQGRLIELPCKVGDTVYLIYNSINDSKWRLAIGFYSVTDILLNVNREPLVRISNTYGTFKLSEFGKKVFLTKEEAEAKLEELKGE